MNRHGMTLIELISALALSALLMAVLMGTISQQVKATATIREKRPFEPWKTLLVQQLEKDFSGCRHVVVRPNRLVFDGYAAFEQDVTVSSGPSRIEYFLSADHDGNRMMRKQEDLLSVQSDRTRMELVCHNVSRIETSTRLSTDVAPAVLDITISFTDSSGVDPVHAVLVRHGGF